MAIRHFLTLRDLNASEFNYIIKLAIEMKAARREGRQEKIFDGKVLGMIFEKSSTKFALCCSVRLFNLKIR